jgi:HSP20 family protein
MKSAFNPVRCVSGSNRTAAKQEMEKQPTTYRKRDFFYPWDMIDRVFNPRIWSEFAPVVHSGRIFRDLESSFDNFSPRWNPRVDVVETNENYVIHAEIPGVPKENVKVEINEAVLTIRGQREDVFSKTDEKNQDIHRERFFGSFSRSFSLPEDVETKAIKASFKDGVLELTIPKKREAKDEKKVEIPIE